MGLRLPRRIGMSSEKERERERDRKQCSHQFENEDFIQLYDWKSKTGTVYTSHALLMASSHVWIFPIKKHNYAPPVSPSHIGQQKRPISRRRRRSPTPAWPQDDGPTRNQSNQNREDQMAVVDSWYSGTPSLCSCGRRLLAQSIAFPRQCSTWFSALHCICRDRIPRECLTGSYRWFGVNPEFDRGLQAGESCQGSVTFSWWLISSSVVSTVLSSRLSPGLGPAPSC